MSIESGEPEELGLEVSGVMRHLQVHPDGQTIAFNLSKTTSEVWVIEDFLTGVENTTKHTFNDTK